MSSANNKSLCFPNQTYVRKDAYHRQGRCVKKCGRGQVRNSRTRRCRRKSKTRTTQSNSKKSPISKISTKTFITTTTPTIINTNKPQCTFFQRDLHKVFTILGLDKLTEKDFPEMLQGGRMTTACDILRARLQPIYPSIPTEFYDNVELVPLPINQMTLMDNTLTKLELNKIMGQIAKIAGPYGKPKVKASRKETVEYVMGFFRQVIRLRNPKMRVQYNLKRGSKSVNRLHPPPQMNLSRFYQKLKSVGFPQNFKKMLSAGVVSQAAIYNNIQAASEQLTANLGQVLGKTFQKSGWKIVCVYGAGEFGLTFGVRNANTGENAALKLVLEQKKRNFEHEISVHERFAKHKLAPHIFKKNKKAVVYQGLKKVKNKFVLAYVMGTIDGVAAEMFTKSRSKQELFFFANEMTRLVRKMVDYNLVHGDMHMDNIAIMDKQLVLIDFGYSHFETTWPMYDIMQIVRGMALTVADNVYQHNEKLVPCPESWACENYRRSFNRLFLIFRYLYKEFNGKFKTSKWQTIEQQQADLEEVHQYILQARHKFYNNKNMKRTIKKSNIQQQQQLATTNKINKMNKRKLGGALKIVNVLYEQVDKKFDQMFDIYTADN